MYAVAGIAIALAARGIVATINAIYKIGNNIKRSSNIIN